MLKIILQKNTIAHLEVKNFFLTNFFFDEKVYKSSFLCVWIYPIINFCFIEEKGRIYSCLLVIIHSARSYFSA